MFIFLFVIFILLNNVIYLFVRVMLELIFLYILCKLGKIWKWFVVNFFYIVLCSGLKNENIDFLLIIVKFLIGFCLYLIFCKFCWFFLIFFFILKFFNIVCFLYVIFLKILFFFEVIFIFFKIDFLICFLFFLKSFS